MRHICQRNVAVVLNEVRDLIATLFADVPSTSARAVSYHGGAWYGQSIHALLSALPRGALHVAGCCSMEDAQWRCEQLNSSCWTVAPETCLHLQSPRRVNLFHLLVVIPWQAGCSPEPQHTALASGCLIPPRRCYTCCSW